MTTIVLLLGLSFFINSCSKNSIENNNKDTKAIIIQTEKEFAEMAKQKDVAEAFLYYAAEDAVLFRNNTLIKGKKAIKDYFEKQTLKDIKIEWKPDYVDVANSGDLAYTYGHFTFSGIKPDGQSIKADGIFHTIWKKQKNGKWKFVWD